MNSFAREWGPVLGSSSGAGVMRTNKIAATAASATARIKNFGRRCISFSTDDEKNYCRTIESEPQTGVALHLEPVPHGLVGNNVETAAFGGENTWAKTVGCTGRNRMPELTVAAVVQLCTLHGVEKWEIGVSVTMVRDPSGNWRTTKTTKAWQEKTP